MTDISICMPYFNRAEPLKKTLKSYSNNGYFNSRTWAEVCLCDDGSKIEPATEIPDYPWLRRSYLPQKDGWMCACTPLNKAVDMAEGELIMLTSPEVYHPKPVLFQMMRMVKTSKDVVLACVKADTYEPRMQRWNGWYAHPEHRPLKFWWCQVMRRALFNEVGGFDEGYREGKGWEDTDFVERLTKIGANWIWAEDCIVRHPFIKGKPKIRGSKNAKRFKETHGEYRSKFI